MLPTSRPTYSNVICQRLCSLSGTRLPWKTEIKYLGVQIVSSKSFKVSTEQSRCSFYRATNAIFGRIGRIATEDVVLHLLQTKCIPVFGRPLGQAYAIGNPSVCLSVRPSVCL